METPKTVSPGGDPARQAAAAAVAPDPVTAAILAKHSAGQPLTPQESGKLGWWRSLLKKNQAGKGGPGPGSPGAGPAPGQPAPVGASGPGAESPGGLAPVPPDPGVIRRCTETVLNVCDNFGRGIVAREARAAGADDRSLARIDAKAALPAGAKEMMVGTAPDVAALIGISPETMPVATFLGGLGLWATNLWLAVDELRAIREQNDRRAAAERKTAEKEKPHDPPNRNPAEQGTLPA